MEQDTYIFPYLVILVLGQIIDGLPCIHAIGNAETKREVIRTDKLVLQ